MDAVRLADALNMVESKTSQSEFVQVITANTLMILDAESDAELQRIFESAGLVLPESVGVSLLAQVKGLTLPERIPGIDFMIELCALAAQKAWPVYLLGSKPGVAEQAADRLKIRFPKLTVSGVHHGFFNPADEPGILQDILQSKARILFVGLGVPAQEKWIFRNAHNLSGICAMGIGGSLDVISGALRRAPRWVSAAGLEWVYRWVQEPWRWKRMIRLPVLLYKGLK